MERNNLYLRLTVPRMNTYLRILLSALPPKPQGDLGWQPLQGNPDVIISPLASSEIFLNFKKSCTVKNFSSCRISSPAWHLWKPLGCILHMQWVSLGVSTMSLCPWVNHLSAALSSPQGSCQSLKSSAGPLGRVKTCPSDHIFLNHLGRVEHLNIVGFSYDGTLQDTCSSASIATLRVTLRVLSRNRVCYAMFLLFPGLTPPSLNLGFHQSFLSDAADVDLQARLTDYFSEKDGHL